MAGPRGLTAQSDVLYENLGNGTFRSITEPAGCVVAKPAYGLGVVILDFDGDARADIFVGNDAMGNFLFRNMGNRRFEEIGIVSGIAYNHNGMAEATMGIAIADVDGNGFPDIFTTNFSGETNTLSINTNGKSFEDCSERYNLELVSRPFLSWGTGFYDFDSDGDEDLFVANGHVFPEASLLDQQYEQRPLFLARNDHAFEVVAQDALGSVFQEPCRGRATVFGDLDNDGDIDIIMATLNGPLKVISNESPPGRWLIVALKDTRRLAKNHRALGSRIELVTPAGRQTRWIYSGGSFQSSSAPYAHFGLSHGKGWSHVSVIVTWPDGGTMRLDGVPIGRRLLISRSSDSP